MKHYPFAVDNTLQLEKLLDYKEGCYYKFFLVVRKKDKLSYFEDITNVKTEKLIKFWIVSNEEGYNKKLKEMSFFCSLFSGSRLYLNIDRKSAVKTQRRLRDRVIKELDNQSNNILFDSSVTSEEECSEHTGKRILLDVDFSTDENEKRQFNEFLEYLDSKYEYLKLKTLNGWHIILPKTFDSTELKKECEKYKWVDFKTNAATLILMSCI